MANPAAAASPAAHLSVRVQAAPFDPGAELNAFQAGSVATGAIATFVGLVRDLNLDRSVAALHLEHYPGMTEHVLQEIAGQAAQRWPLQRLQVIHRHGDLLPGDPIVLVQVASAHREAALQACAFVMDLLKTQAPFWKRETTPDGPRWVDARASDTAAAGRWQPGDDPSAADRASRAGAGDDPAPASGAAHG